MICLGRLIWVSPWVDKLKCKLDAPAIFKEPMWEGKKNLPE
jgi:hypothetical protein